MISNKLVLALTAATAVLAAPTPQDITVLQYALTLEHLENAFYTGALAKFDEAAFERDGFPNWVRGRFEQISQHEANHVNFLTSTLGPAAPKPCQYTFPYSDARSFVDLAMGIEGVGAAAYLGAAPLITDKDVLVAAGSILAVEQRQEGWISSSALKVQPWDGAYETPLSPSEVYSLASPFIVANSCPASNPTLPIKQLPMLTVSSSTPKAGEKLHFKYDGQGGQTVYAAFLTGLEVIFTPISADCTTVVPPGLHGTVYVVVASSNLEPFGDDKLVSGLAILQFPFGSGHQW